VTLYDEYRAYMYEYGLANHTECHMQYGGFVLQIRGNPSLGTL